MRARLAPLLVPALFLVAACDPCSGVSGCDAGPHVTYEGRVVDHFSKAAVAGTRVEFRRTGGVALERDTLLATTDGEGRFVLRSDVAQGGTVVGDVVVDAPAPYGGYVVRGVEMRSVATGGDGRFLPTWVADPFEDLQWEVRRRSDGQLVRGARVEFRRTAGVPVVQQPYVTATDSAGGRFRLRVTSPELGVFRGDLRFTPAGRNDVWLVPDIGVATLHEDRDSRLLGVMLVGPTLAYDATLQYEDGAPAAGVEVRFRRTGGLEATPAQLTVVTDVHGRFPLRPVPVDARSGTVVGELQVRAPGAASPFLITGISLPTYEADEVRHLDTWKIPRP